MFISQFVCGILATLSVEFLCAVIFTITHRYEDESDNHSIIVDATNKDDVKELLSLLQRMEEKSNGKDDNN